MIYNTMTRFWQPRVAFTIHREYIRVSLACLSIHSLIVWFVV